MTSKKIGLGVAVVSILLFALAIRSFTFFLQHWQGDQSQYVGLAMKYDTLGLDGLNLQQTEIHQLELPGVSSWQLTYPSLAKDPEQSDYFKAYEKFGLEFNKMPLYHKSPLFSVALAMSHRIFAAPGQPFVVVKTMMEDKPKPIQFRRFFFTAQLWAVIVPLLSSLLTILLTFFFARRLFDNRTALYAMLLMVIHPVGIVTSYKVLSDDFVTCLVAAALLFFYISFEKKSLFLAFVSGLAAGLAVLAKQSAVLILPAMALFALFAGDEPWYRPRAWMDFFKKPYFLCFFLGAFFISAHWFFRVYRVYGDPFFQPAMEKILDDDLSGWFGLLSHRPSAFILFLFNVPFLCPPFLFGHLTFKDFVRELIPSQAGSPIRRQLFFLWFWILPFVLFFTFRLESREERYLLPIYPALAMLSAYGLNAMQERFSRYYSKPVLVGVFVGIFLALTIAWSVPIGLETVFKERFLILEPIKLVRLFYRMHALTAG